MKLVIFDFDGTIIDTETAWYYIYRDVLQHEYQFKLELEHFLKIVGTTDDMLFDFLDKSMSNTLDRVLFNQQIEKHFSLHRKNLSLREGVIELIEKLTESGVQLAIASSSTKEWVMGFLEEYNLFSHFSTVKTKDDVKMVKPDPSLYLEVLKDHSITPKDAVAIEDSVYGSLAAIRAGIKCIVVPNMITKTLNFPEEVTHFDSFMDVNLFK